MFLLCTVPNQGVSKKPEESNRTTYSRESALATFVMPLLTVILSGVVAAVIAVSVSKFNSKTHDKQVSVF